MPISRYGHAAAAATNGKIYVVGGTNATTGPVTQVDEYDPVTNSWTTKSNTFSSGAWGVGLVAAANGKLYAAGGRTSSTLDTLEEYNPATDTWTSKAPMLTARQTLGVVQADSGKLYAIGGGFSGATLTTATDAVEEYDITTDTWIARTSMPTARGGVGVAKASNGKIYAIGGFTSEPGFVTLDTVEEYDPATDTWSTKASMPTPRFHLSVVASNDGKIYAVGGTNRTGSIFNVVEQYNPATDMWISVENMPTARYNLAATLGGNGKVYAIGGWVGGSMLTTDVVEEASSANLAPTVDANGPYTVNEGSSVSVSATGNDPESGTLTYDWDLDNNGSFETSGQTVNFSAASIDGPGSRTIIVRVTDDGNLTAIDEATVQIDNVAPVVAAIDITPTGNIPLGTALSASATFTDAGTSDTHTATWDWGDSSTDSGTVTESSGSGSVTDPHTYAAAGNYTITLTVSDGQGGTHQATTLVTVVKQLTSLDPAKVWVGLKNSDAVGIKFDLKAEVYKDGVLVTSGQLDSVPGGSSGFGNANLNTIPFASFSPVDFPAGSNLSVKVSARNACVGSGKNSGTARLWFNDSAANSQFGATITLTASDYYLLDGFSLGTSAGSGPKKNIDVAAGAKCSPFKTFGTWAVTP